MFHVRRARFRALKPFTFALVTALLCVGASRAEAAANLTITPLTWNIVGLDSNNPLNQGPYEFLSAARVCNTGTTAANTITVTYNWDTANTYINVSPRGTASETDPFILPGACKDYYFLIRVTRTPLAYNTTRKFHITATASNASSVSTPLNREIFVEHLISQNRNDVILVDGPTSVYVGQTVDYHVHSNTATQGYEQLSSFLDFPNLLFRVLAVSQTYSSSGQVNDRVYTDACTWDPNIGPTPPSGTYRSCLSTGKNGNEVLTTYTVKFMSAGSSSVIETVYDFSGSSYHYNADIGLNTVNITTLTQLDTVKINKHCDPKAATPGGTITCTIDYANSGTTTLTGVQVKETYDPRTTYVTASPLPSTGNNIWNVGTMAPGSHGTISVTLTVSNSVIEGDSLLNHVELSDATARANTTAGSPAGNFASDDDTIPVTTTGANQALLRITKTPASSLVAAGDNAVYTIHYQNAGTATAYSAVVTDTLPTGLTFVSSVPAPTTSVSPTYTWSLGNLAPGASGNITLTAAVGTGLANATLLINPVTITATTGPGTNNTNGLTASSEGDVFVRSGSSANADLSITKTDPGTGVAQGGFLTYTLSVHNNGPDIAVNTVVTDTLNANTTYVNDSGGCTNASGTLTCNLGNMASGATTNFTVTVQVSSTAPTAGTVENGACSGTSTTDICNVASVTSNTTDATPGNNTDDEPTDVTSVASVCDLSITKTDATDPIARGASLTYNLVASNAGPAATGAGGVTFIDELPAGVTYVSSSFNGGGSCAQAGQTLTCSFNSNFPSGGSKNGSITVTVNNTAPTAITLGTGAVTGACTASSADLCNRITSLTGGTGCKDTNQANNLATQPTNVSSPNSDLSLTKTDGTDPVPQGGDEVYTINVTNNSGAGLSNADNVVVADTLPANVTYLSTTASGGCVLASGTTYNCSLGTIAVGATSSFTITVRVNTGATTTLTAGNGAVTGACTAATADLCNSATVSSNSNDPTPANNTATQPTNVTAVLADLSLTKTDSGDPLLEGGVMVYTFTASNLGTSSAQNVVVTDTLSNNEYYLEDTASGGCILSPGGAGGTLTCSLGTIANLGSASFTVTVFVPTGAPTTITPGNAAVTGACTSLTADVCNIAVVSSSTPDPVAANNTANQPTNILAASADVQITKTDTGFDPAGLGGTVTYAVHVANPGPQDAQNVTVTDTLDSNTTYVSDTFGCVEGPTHTLTCDVGALLVGQTYDFTITVTVSNSAPTGSSKMTGDCTATDICNTIVISSTTSDPTPANNTATQPTNVLAASADLSITKSDAGFDPVSRGGTLTYSLTVTNNGPSTATSVVVTDVLDSDTTYVSNTGGCTNSAGTLTCNLGNMASGASTSFTVTTTVSNSAPVNGTLSSGACDGSEDLCNTASVTSATADTNSANNSDDEPTDVNPVADMAVDKTGPSSVIPGQNVVYTVTVTNNGPSAAANVSVADPTPSGLTFVSNTGDCTSAYPCSLGTVASGGTRTITSTYSVPSSYTTPDPVVNTATVSTTTSDPVSGNNSDGHSAPVARQADLSMAKTDGSSTYSAGSTITYTVTASNAGPSDVTGATVSDTLPPQIAGATWTCSGSGGGTCTASGSGSINDTSVNLPKNASVTYTITAHVIAGTTVNPLANTATVSVPAGTTDPTPGNNSATDNDTPAAATSQIGDRVWVDEDGDGVQDAGEDGLPGITVRLFASDGTTLLQTTTTDSDGRYIFTGVAAGNYIVRVNAATLPAGLAANPTYDLDNGTTTPNGETAVTVTAGVFLDTADFGYNWVAPATSTNPALAATGSIGDRIWNDADQDGIQDFGEAGIAGVTVRLLTDDNGDGIYGGAGDNAPVSTTTDAYGNYIFDGIAPRAYEIEVNTATLPAGFSTTPTADPDSDGNSVTKPIVLAPGDVYLSGDFGYRTATGHTIGDTIFVDLDADGVRDPGEPGIPGVTVTLLNASNQIVASTTSDATGTYLFPGLPNGTYTVVVTDTANVLADTSRNTADPDGGFDRRATLTLSGADQLTEDFGFAPPGHTATSGLIGDTIFLDRNNNGSADAGEGIEGVTVQLYASNGTTLISTVVTDVNGQYVFGGLDATATYVVKVVTTSLPNAGAGLSNTVDPDGGIASQATVNLTLFTNGQTLTQDFAYQPATPNTISGTVFNDVNGNGTKGAGETGGYQNVVVTLFDSNGDVVATTTTDASGNYTFSRVPNGTYTVEVSESGNVLGGLTKSNGANPGADNNSQVRDYAVTVTGGQTNTTADFGYFRPGASLGNFIFNDTDDDGIQDVGETGIAGAVITMTITYPSGDVTTVVTTSDALGAYSFGNLLLDEQFDGVGGGEPAYSISVATPSGFQASPINQGGNPLVDSNDPSGSSATPVQGQTSTTNNALATNGIDFGFTPVADLAISKTGPGGVTPGFNVVYTIIVTNNGPADSNNVVVTDPTPTGLTFVSNSGGCVGAFPCSLGTILSGHSVTITSTFSVPGGYTTPDPIVNTATVSSSTVDPVPGNNSDDASTNLTFTSADLEVAKSGPVSVSPGQNVVFTILVTNHGPDTANNVTVTDPTPGGLTFVSNSGSCSGAFPCALGAIANGGTATITSTYSVPANYTAPNPIVNTAVVSADEGDPDPGNNSDDHSVNLVPQADLTMTKDDGSAVYVPGGSLTYTITVSNLGPSAVTGASVSDAFPPELNNVSWTCSGSGGGSCSASGSGDISDSVNLPVGASVTYLANADVIAGASANPLINSATVAPPPGTTDPTPGNNTDDDQDAPTASPSSIGDRLWLDEDGDGVQDAGEDGIAGVTVQLYDSTGTILLTATTTDTDGRYIFTNVAAGTYQVRVDTTTMAAGLAANPTYDLDGTGSANVTTITVAAGVFDDTADFGYNWVAAATSSNPAAGATGAIGDRIWNDADMDGIQDFGEAGIPNVTVRLLSDDNGDGIYGGAGDSAPLTTTTDASGHYIFDGVAAGAYVIDVVTATLPGGYSTTPTGDPDSDGDNSSNPIILAPGDVFVNGDFGYPLPAGHDIGSSIFVDADADGVHDPGEPGIAGVTVSLLDNGGNIIASTVSDASGNYLFPGLPDGTYTVVVTDSANVLADVSTNTADPDGGFDRLSTVALSGADELTQDFGFAPAGQDPGDGLIGDTIFLDRDSDGVADPGEGMQGVTVNLYAANGTTLIATVVTDVNGQYVFGGLDASATYVVKVDTTSLPNGGAGLTNTVDPDGGTASQSTVDLTLFPNGLTFTQDFAYRPATPNTIGGTVFDDSNGNGTKGAGENTGYPGITVTLHDQNGSVVATTTTDASGNYQFTQVPNGTYTIEVTEAGNVLGGLTKSNGPNPGVDNNSQVAGYSVTVGGGSTDNTGDFGYFSPGAALGNFIFNDADNDGIQDPGETGLAGVAVTLTITYPNGDVSTIVTVSDVNGAYSFGNLLIDESFDGVGGGEPTYSISVTTPTGYQASPIAQGGNTLVDSNDPGGASASPVEGQRDTTNNALAPNSIDFGFVAVTNVSISKTGPGGVTPGTNIVYTIIVTNNGPSDADNVIVADSTPTGLTFVSNANGCTTAFPCSLGTLASGASVTITSTYSVPGGYTTPDPIVNTATVSTDTFDTNALDDSDSASTNLTFTQADLEIVKSGPATVTPGNNVVFTLTITNHGPATATAVTVTDPTPGGLSFVSNSGNCSGAFPCNLGNIAVGGTRTITSTYHVPASYTSPDPIDNTAVVSGAQADPTPANNTDDAQVALDPQADLSVTKTGPASVSAGSNAVWTITVTNSGTSDAQNVVVDDPTPSGLTFVSNSGACSTSFPCSLGTVAAGQTRVITTTFAVPVGYTSPDPVDNTAIVASSTPDPDPSDNSDTASSPLVGSADLSIAKSDPGTSVNRNSNFTYTIAVTNNGPSSATGVTVVDTLDTHTTYVSDTGGCVQGPVGTLTCPVGNVANGASTSFTITVHVSNTASFSMSRENGTCNGAEDLCNQATVSANEHDPSPANNTDREPTDVASVDLAVVKSDSGTGVNVNEDFPYTITVTNGGPATATNVVAVDTLDADTTYVSDSIGCVQGPVGVLTCPIGTLAPSAQTSFTVVVHVSSTAPTGGTRESGACNNTEDLCNRVTVSSSQAEATPGNNTDTEPTDVHVSALSADLSITKTDLSSPVQRGAFATYRLTVTNSGPDTATAATVVDTLDSDMTFVTSTAQCTEAPAGLLTCALGDLANGATVTFDVVVHVSATAPIASSLAGVPCTGAEDMCNRASVSSTSSDPDPSDNVADVATNVVATTTTSALTLTKSDIAVEPVQPGSNVTYQVVVDNAGPDTAASVVVYDTLDPFMTYVSDTAGCTPSSATGAQTVLTCPLGNITSGSSSSFQVVVTVSPNAPVDSTMQDGDCNNAQDICNDATVTTASADFNIVDNEDSEPTDVSALASCNNGIVDPGEQCDPVDAEICNNGVDDDGNNAVDCADAACQGVGVQSCNGNCQLTPPCQAILNDPAILTLTKLHVHGRFIPVTTADPATEDVDFAIYNDNGEVYSGHLLAGDMTVRSGKTLSKWLWKDKSAKTSPPGMRNGIFRLGIHQRYEDDGSISYVFSISAYGNMSAATLSTMTTFIYIGDDVGYLTADWEGKPGKWHLHVPELLN